MSRQCNFFKKTMFLQLITIFLFTCGGTVLPQTPPPEKPSTNVKEASRYPRSEKSMPGKYPGKVVQVTNDKSVSEKKFSQEEIDKMLETGMLELTGKKSVSEAWLTFVSPADRIGLKVNPVAGPELSTSVEITKAIVQQLEKAGVPKKNIVIWDRREFELYEAGFTHENFPGVTITGTERKDGKGSFYDTTGALYSMQMIDTSWYYWADTEEKYDSATIPYMVNEGKYSYFSKIVTQQLDKIINVPILKNAGSSVTLCLKNLAYGAVTNTGRLHKQLWSETSAEVCAFPPLRDKVVLNIVDGIKGCYNGGPGANPDFITEFKTILIGTDPVAVDRVGYDIILKKRFDEKVQKEESPRGKKFLELAEELRLGTADLTLIEWKKITQ